MEASPPPYRDLAAVTPQFVAAAVIVVTPVMAVDVAGFYPLSEAIFPAVFAVAPTDAAAVLAETAFWWGGGHSF